MSVSSRIRRFFTLFILVTFQMYFRKKHII